MVSTKKFTPTPASIIAAKSLKSANNAAIAVVDETPANPEIFKSYQEAGRLADESLSFALSLFSGKSEVKVFDLCWAIDMEMRRLCETVAKASVAFPCAISPNDLICHFSPTGSDPEAVLKTGDVIKIELGIHVDNCPAFVCHSFVFGDSSAGSKADLLTAAYTAAQATINALRPGQKCLELADSMANIPADFGVNYTQGLMTHVIGRNNLAGDKGIVYRPTADQRKNAEAEGAVVGANEVYLVDVVVSNGQYAVARPTTYRTSIFKKSGTSQSLRFKNSRQFLNEISNKYGLMAFSLRDFDKNESRSRIALKECMTAELVHSYDVIADLDEKACTARFAFTVITGSDENSKATLLTHPKLTSQSDKTPSAQTQALLN